MAEVLCTSIPQAVTSMETTTAPRYGNRRADCPGYLEFIWRLPTDAPNPQAIAYITDVYGTPRKPWFCGVYGIHVVEASTVAAVKAELFSFLDAGQ